MFPKRFPRWPDPVALLHFVWGCFRWGWNVEGAAASGNDWNGKIFRRRGLSVDDTMRHKVSSGLWLPVQCPYCPEWIYGWSAMRDDTMHWHASDGTVHRNYIRSHTVRVQFRGHTPSQAAGNNSTPPILSFFVYNIHIHMAIQDKSSYRSC